MSDTIARLGTDATGTQEESSSISFSHTLGTGGTNVTVWVAIGCAGTTISSVTYGGVSMTALTGQGSGPSVRWFYLVNPSGSGSKTVAATLAASSDFIGGYCTALENTDQTTPVDVGPVGGTASAAVTPPNDGAWVLGAGFEDSESGVTAGAGDTELVNLDINGRTIYVGMETASSGGVSHTISGTNCDAFSTFAVRPSNPSRTVTVKDSGGDYTDIQSAVDAADVSSGKWIVEISEDNAYDEEVDVDTVTGTPSATNYIVIRAAAANAHSGVLGTGHARVVPNVGSGHAFHVSLDYTVIEDLEIHQDTGANSAEGIRVQAIGVIVSRCIIWSDTDTDDQDGIYFGPWDAEVHVDNCLIFGFARAGLNFQQYGGASGWDHDAYVDHTAFSDCGKTSEGESNAINMDSSHADDVQIVTVYNSWATDLKDGAKGIGTSGSTGAQTANGSHLATDDGLVYVESILDTDNTTNIVLCSGGLTTTTTTADAIIVTNVGASTFDATPKAATGGGSNEILEAGTDRQGSEPDSRQDFSTDIAGNARGTTGVDIGPFQFSSEAATNASAEAATMGMTANDTTPDVATAAEVAVLALAGNDATVSTDVVSNAVGDLLVMVNDSDTSTLDNSTGSPLDSTYNATPVKEVGGSITYSAGVFTIVETGRYLVMYSEQFGTTDTTANQRNNWGSWIRVNSTDTPYYGWDTGYIRKSGGSQEEITSGVAILDLTATDTLRIRHERVDDETGTTTRIADRSGCVIVRLDDTAAFATYTGTATTTSATDNADTTLDLNAGSEDGTVFSRTGDIVTIDTANPVLFAYSTRSVDNTANSRSEYQSFLEFDGVAVPISWDQTYIRGYALDDWGGTSSGGLLYPDDTGEDLTVEIRSREAGGDDFAATLQLLELPATAKTILVEATTGDLNGSAVDFAWDTNPEIDTDVFTHTAGTADIDFDVAGDFLAFASLAETTDAGSAVTRAVPAISFRLSNVEVETAGASTYNRSSGTADHGAAAVSGLIPDVADTDDFQLHTDRLGTASGTITVGAGGMALVQLSSIIPSGAATTDADAEAATLALAANNPGTAVAPTAEAAAVAVAAQDATVDITTTTDADAETADLTLTAQDADTAIAPTADAADIAVTANDAGADTTHDADAEAAELALDANDATVTTEASTDADAETATIAVTANDAGADTTHDADAETAELTLDANDATIDTAAATNANAETADLTLEANNPDTSIDGGADTADIDFTANDATVTTDASTSASAEAAALTLAALDPDVAIDASAQAASIVLSALDAVVDLDVSVSAENALLSLAANDATVDLSVQAAAEAAVLALQALDPTVDTEEAANAAAEAAELTLAAQDAAASIATTAETADLSFISNDATVDISINANPNAEAAELAYNAYDATISLSTSADAEIAQLTLTAPDASIDLQVTAEAVAMAVVALDALISTDESGDAGIAELTFSANDPDISIDVSAAVAALALQALDAVVDISITATEFGTLTFRLLGEYGQRIIISQYDLELLQEYGQRIVERLSLEQVTAELTERLI